MKFNALSGIILVTIILAVVGGVLNGLAVWTETADLSILGKFEAPIVSFLKYSFVIPIVTWFYNIFLYLKSNVSEVQEELKKYDTTKFLATFTWFIGTLGAIFALAPTDEIKQWGAFILVILTIVFNQIKHIFKALPTPPSNP